jgi:hypothetical protein
MAMKTDLQQFDVDRAAAMAMIKDLQQVRSWHDNQRLNTRYSRVFSHIRIQKQKTLASKYFRSFYLSYVTDHNTILHMKLQ